MMTNFKSSYIIPYFHSDINLKLLKNNLNQLLKDTKIEVLIVELGENSVLKNLDMKSKVIHLETKKWDLAWAFNSGVKYITTEKIFFGSFEFLPNLQLINRVIDSEENFKGCILQSKIKLADKNFLKNKKTGEEINSPGGIYFFNYTAINEVSGWDENLSGDSLYLLQNFKMEKLLKFKQFEDSSVIKLPVNIPETDENKDHLEKVKNYNTDKLKKYLQLQNKKIADLHKYRENTLLEYHV
jgi:hypothetical protein